MFVPEAAVNKDDGTILAEYKIGASRKRTLMKPISEAHRKQSVPD
jgi:hypothetical protein